ncbi:MAG TPA: peptidoglycan-binding domain-containing protein [Solirubrobacteraceae bacterium]|nr:peptidoglycan-binding domain-containing protein [Solirubrobacteraceae bacterium]
MTSSYRLILCFVAVVLLVPVQAASAKKRSYSLGDRTLKQGHTGKDVRSLQRFLTRAGVETAADGVFGSGTTRAVKAFEDAQRRKVDGVVSRPDVAVIMDVARNGGAVASAVKTGGALPKNLKIKVAPPAPEAPPPLVLGPGMQATVGPDGYAVAPALAPPIVQQVIAAGNLIAHKPYIYGGGHGKWEDAGYDCSGSVSYALHGAGLLETAMPSGGFMNWGDAGPGQWITIYAHGGHMYMVVAGLRFDTSGRTRAGTRWQADMRSTSGYTVRHPKGL